jgi:hypothetical protein
MRGLYLNSYPLTCEGTVSLFKLPGAAASRRRDEIQRAVGVNVWVEGDDAYAYQEPCQQAAEVSRSLEQTDNLALFILREILVDHCRSLGFDSWVARAGELRVVGVIPHMTEDRFRVEHVLNLRVSAEEYIRSGPLLTARHRTSWQCSDPLSDPDIAALAPRQRAVRLGGEGPPRGRVVRVAGSSVFLRVGSEEVEVAAKDYTLTANAAFVSRWRGSAVLRKVRMSSGELTISGKRNQHGIEDRFKLAARAVRQLGGEIALVGGGRVEIAKAPVQIRLEAT